MTAMTRLGELGLALLAFVIGTAAAFALLATCGFPWPAPPALALGLAAALLLARGPRVETVAGVLLVTALALWLAQLRFDVWWDGMAYHQDAIVNIAREFSLLQGQLDGRYSELTSHYPKLSWYWGAAVYSLTGDVQYAKSLNFVLLAAVLAIAPAVLAEVRPWLRVAATLALAFNPIAVSQMFTTMVDGAMAHVLTLLALGLHAFARRTLPRPRALTLVALAAIGAASLKFTGLVFACTALGFLAAMALLPLPPRAEWAAATAARLRGCGAILRRPIALVLATLALLLLFNPYATNLLAGKHALHPAMGAERLELMENQSTPEFRELDPASRLLLSVFSRSVNLGSWTEQKLPEPKIPFTVYPDELRSFEMVETRVGGWGPLCGGILLCTLLLVLARLEELRGFAPVLGFLALIAVLNPEAWWARFNPQLVTLIAFALLAVAGVGVATRAFAGALTVLLLLNSVIVFRPMYGYATSANQWIDEHLRGVAAQVQDSPVYFQMSNFHVELMLDRLGIEHRPRTEYAGPEEALDCYDLELYPGFPEQLCLVNPRLLGAR